MQRVKEKISNMSSGAKEQIKIGKAQAEEKLEKAAARTEEEKKLAHERKKAKEAEAKMELHQEKMNHLEKKMRPKQPEYLHGYGYDHHAPPLPTAGAAATGQPPIHGHNKY